MNLRGEVVKILSFIYKNWLMTQRNTFTILEIVFWPTAGLLSVELLTKYLDLTHEVTDFILSGVISIGVVQVCHLDVAYVLLYSVWSKSIKHEFVAPVSAVQFVLGSWVVGVLRGLLVFALLSMLSGYFFGFEFSKPGVFGMILFLFGIFCSAAIVGVVIFVLILMYGQKAEVAAWSLVGFVLLISGIYYPVSILPKTAVTVAGFFPITYFLEYYRSFYGFSETFADPLIKGYAATLAYFLLGVFTLERVINRARKTGMLIRLSK